MSAVMDVYEVTLDLKMNGVWTREYATRTILAKDATEAIGKALKQERRYGGIVRAAEVKRIATISQ